MLRCEYKASTYVCHSEYDILKYIFPNQNGASPTWRQLLLFPEGTCTNGKGLIHFKAGAFQNGVPVQPVVIRFKSKPDTLTWTWDQSYGAFACLWLTLCQFNTRMEVRICSTVYYIIDLI